MKIELLEEKLIDVETGKDLIDLEDLTPTFSEAVIRELIYERDRLEDENLRLEQEVLDKQDFIEMMEDNI